MTKAEIASIPSDTKPLVRRLLRQINELKFSEAKQKSKEIFTSLNQPYVNNEDLEFNKHYVFTLYGIFLKDYVEFWESIYLAEMNKSWIALQNCLDCLRSLKMFSIIDISFFEKQLVEIEKAYPYAVFVSPGLIAEYFECSICGLDIDSDECRHLRGNLYQGQAAYGIARGTCEAEHIAIVKNPKDKRCVIFPPDGKGELTDFTKLLSKKLKEKQLFILDFDRVEISYRQLENNEDYSHAHLAFVPRRLSQIPI